MLLFSATVFIQSQYIIFVFFNGTRGEKNYAKRISKEQENLINHTRKHGLVNIRKKDSNAFTQVNFVDLRQTSLPPWNIMLVRKIINILKGKLLAYNSFDILYKVKPFEVQVDSKVERNII